MCDVMLPFNVMSHFPGFLVHTMVNTMLNSLTFMTLQINGITALKVFGPSCRITYFLLKNGFHIENFAVRYFLACGLSMRTFP